MIIFSDLVNLGKFLHLKNNIVRDNVKKRKCKYDMICYKLVLIVYGANFKNCLSWVDMKSFFFYALLARCLMFYIKVIFVLDDGTRYIQKFLKYKLDK